MALPKPFRCPSLFHPRLCRDLLFETLVFMRPTGFSTSNAQPKLPSRSLDGPEPVLDVERMAEERAKATEEALLSGEAVEASVATSLTEGKTIALNWARWRLRPLQPREDGWAYAGCPRCHTPEAPADAFPTIMANTHTGKFFCAVCGHHGDASVAPSQYRATRVDLSDPWWQTLNDEELESWLHNLLPKGLPFGLEVGLDRALVTHSDGRQAWEISLVFPVRQESGGDIVSLVFLPMAEDGTLYKPQDLPGTASVPWGWDKVSDNEVIFVEHPLDRIALEQAGVVNSACLPPRMNPLLPSGGDWSALPLIEKKLQTIGRVVMALRDDEGGQRWGDEMARRVGKERCFRTRWTNYKVKEGTARARTVLNEHGPDLLREAIETAPNYPVAGIHEMNDVEEEFDLLYEFGLQPGVSTGWPSLDYLYTVKPGRWTVVHGIPGHGKSSFLDSLIVNLAQMHGWRFGVFSPESQPVARHFAGLMEKASGKPFSEGAIVPRITLEEKDQYKKWLQEHFKMILPDEENEQSWTVDGILALARTLVYRFGIKGLVIDPWNELNHMRPAHMTEADFIALELSKVRRFARNNEIHIWVVAHPNRMEKSQDGKYAVPTPYMLNGGASWRNKADNILAEYRNLGQLDDDISDLYIQKVRFKEEGRLGRTSLRGDRNCNRHIDDVDHNKRELSLKSPQPMASTQMRVAERKVRTDRTAMPMEAGGKSLPTSY